MATPGPTTQSYLDQAAGNLLRLARNERAWSQRQLAAAAGVPVSTVARIESGTRQPSLLTLFRLLAAADRELRFDLAPYDDHDDVLDARRAMLTDDQRAAEAARFAATSAMLTASREQHITARVGTA